MGWQSIRPDLPRIELMTVQLEESMILIERDTMAHARLAFILLDNAAEVLMFRNIEGLLFYNPMFEQILKRWEEILQHANDTEARQHHDEVKTKIISKTKRAKLEYSFDVKVDFLIGNDRLEATEGRVLKKLHGYRNELYHRDRLRDVTIRSACLLYFEMTCSLFERGDEYPVGEPLNHRVSPELDKYNPSDAKGTIPSAATIAQYLRSKLGIDGDTLKGTLVANLTSRLDQMEADIACAGEMLSGLWSDAVIRLAQIPEGHLPDSLDALLERKLKYGASDFARWRQSVADMQALGDKLELFAAFADIEDSFEPLEVQVEELVERIDHEAQMQTDIERGK
ncbi:MAG TPA: hypothetical protein VJS64_03080 [Pyrinomonadaceae bacterium]|nr:hypothetical protein [Pyrinomonadaceae bacterium]